MPQRFTLIASLRVDPRTARVHEEGRQSWSPSGTYALDSTPYRPANDNWATVCYRPGRNVPADHWGTETTRRLLQEAPR
nr:hypothetical protein [Streptomyces adustus]